MRRCGPTCAGVGQTAGHPCVGCTQPFGTPCAANQTQIEHWAFNPRPGGCDAWACKLQADATDLGESGNPLHLTFGPARIDAGFARNTTPAGSNVVGYASDVSRIVSPLTLEHPAQIAHVTVEGTLTVAMPFHPSSETTVIENVNATRILITPATAHRTHNCYGHVVVQLSDGQRVDPTPHGVAHPARHFDIVVRGLVGTVNAGGGSVLLYESQPGDTTVLNPGHVTNLSAMLGLFNPEYLVEFENDGRLHRGTPVPTWIKRGWFYPVLASAFFWGNFFLVERLGRASARAALGPGGAR